MGWFGPSDHSHPKAQYDSADPATIKRQFDELQSWGVSGVILDWYGPYWRHIDTVGGRMLAECEARKMSFSLGVDQGAISKKTESTGHKEFLALMDYAATFFFKSPAYMQIDGKGVVFEFGMETLPTADQIDWNAVVAKYPDKHFIHRNVGGFALAGSGAYAWLDKGIPYLQDYYKRAHDPSQTKLCFGSLFTGFDNRKLKADGTLVTPDTPVWGALNVIPQDHGQTFLNTVDEANKFLAAGGKLTGVVINTYNDWEEGSAVEGGIDGTGNANAVATPLVMKPMFRQPAI